MLEKYLQKIHHRNCLDLMQEMPKGQIDLIYIDPPFCCEADKKFGMIAWNKNTQHKNRVDEILPLIEEQDIGMTNYLRWMYPRLYLMRELLSDKGSIYVHLDWHICHYIKILMDDIFGKSNLKNEIVWHYEKWTAQSNSLQKNHDNILWFQKNETGIFNIQKEITENLKNKYKKGYLIGGGYGSNGLVVYDKNNPKVKELINSNKYKVVYSEPKGKPLSDVWKISFINPVANERLNYATQKPETLLERIIRTSSNENSIVADFFCGSGTTLAVAEKLGRKWIGCDVNKQAVEIATKRLKSY